MYYCKKTYEILAQAGSIDNEFILFGSKTHKYQLNPPIDRELVRAFEEKYRFKLPEDYFYFITHIGDGGAGPDYGLYRFADFMKDSTDPKKQKRIEECGNNLCKIREPRPMVPEERKEFGISKDYYDANPEKCFVLFESDDDDEEDRGLLTIGTKGCAYDYYLMLTGKMQGKVFEGDGSSLILQADSFDEFYTSWLDELADTESFRRKIEGIKELRRRNGVDSL